MIIVQTSNHKLRNDVIRLAKKLEFDVAAYEMREVEKLFAHDTAQTALSIIDFDQEHLPGESWRGFLAQISEKHAVYVVINPNSDLTFLPKKVNVLERNEHGDFNVEQAFIDSQVATKKSEKLVAIPHIPVFQKEEAMRVFATQKALCLIAVDTSSYKKISTQYGKQAFLKIRAITHRILAELWGTQGSFRASDLLFRDKVDGDCYLIFLDTSRANKNTPLPETLERLTDRIYLRIQNALLNEMFKKKDISEFPYFVRELPEFTVGYAAILKNPCVEIHEQVDRLIDEAKDVGKLEMRRIKNRKKSLIQVLIEGDNYLKPHYQAVFNLQAVTKEMVEESTNSKSIKPLANCLFGFESLIRVRGDELTRHTQEQDALSFIEPKYLNPDLLFQTAKAAKLTLELDLACLELALKNATELPGKLMINVLPRNFYHIDRILNLFAGRSDVVLEISESEGILNYELFMKVYEKLANMGIEVAADDFGKGESSLERLTKIRPAFIKFDRFLIENVFKDKGKQLFLTGLVELSKTQNASIIAEGVERWEEAEVLKDMGIEYVQGYLFHRPQSHEQIVQELNELKKQNPLKRSA